MIVRSGAVSEILTEYLSDKSYGMDLIRALEITIQ